MDKNAQITHAATAIPVAVSSYYYAYRRPCRNIAICQSIVFFLSFLFLYGSWFFVLLGSAVSVIGIYASMEPIDHERAKWVRLYYYTNIWMLVYMAGLSLILFAMLLSDTTDETNTWTDTTLLIGVLSFILLAILMAFGIRYSFQYKQELQRNLPQPVVEA